MAYEYRGIQLDNSCEALGHIFAHTIGNLFTLSQLGDYSHEEAEQSKGVFVSGVHGCIEAISAGNLPVKGNIDADQLNYMLGLVEKEDLSKPEAVMEIYKEFLRLNKRSLEDSMPEWGQ